ncbi:MAG: DUF1329 domain-containing protein [Deltaproteobacteria bacterium]|nr:MAG: DUF1329 domain-containing protein [Deltaproteobacteria bacterium]
MFHDRVFRTACASAIAAVAIAWAGAAEEAGAPAAAWSVPAEGSCAPEGGLRGWPPGEDAPPIPFETGDVLDLEAAPRLANYLPPAIWTHREQFFFEGMQLEIGPCFRDYGPPVFFAAASETFRGRARLLDNGGLENYTAGLPFAPDAIEPSDPQAGLKWAWNVEHRYQGAGFRGKFRVSDMVGRTRRAEPFEGEIFKIHLAYRADRAADAYEAPGSKSSHWVAGGQMFQPFDAREYAWRQYRDVAHLVEPRRSDDLHVYLPTRRRVRRTSAADVEGLYMPSFSVGVTDRGGQLPIAGAADLGGTGGSVDVGGGGASTITTKRSGFEGLELRPLLYRYEILGLQDVLAPINAVRASYPAVTDRDFGPSGLSFASDRWDLRRALVLQGTAGAEKRGAGELARVVQYVDLQTLQPLYYISFDANGEPLDVGYYVGRWSEDRAEYPPWPNDPERSVRVLDPVGAAFANIQESGGWRRESWEVVSTPPSDETVQRMLSIQNLTKRR